MGWRSTRQEVARARSRCRRCASPTRGRPSAARGPNCAAGTPDACDATGTSGAERSNSRGCSNVQRARPERPNNSRCDIRLGADSCTSACSDSQECSGSETRALVEFGSGCKARSRDCAGPRCHASSSTECHRYDASTEGCSGSSRCSASLCSPVTVPCGSPGRRHGTSRFKSRCCSPGSGRRGAACGTCCGTCCGTYSPYSSSRRPPGTAGKDVGTEPPSAANCRASSYRPSASQCVLQFWASDLQG